MKIGLKDAELDLVKKILRKHLPTAKCFVFGSRLQGTHKKYSDLDIAVDVGYPIPLAVLSILKEDFDNSDLLFIVDIVDVHRISDEFKEEIKKSSLDLF